MGFSLNDLGMVQRLLFPLVQTLTKFDPAELIREKGEDFDDLAAVAVALRVVAAEGKKAAEDGIVDGAEIEAVKAAIEQFVAAAKGFAREVIDQQTDAEV